MEPETRVTAGAELGTAASMNVTPHGPVADQHSAFVTGGSVRERPDRIEALKELAQQAQAGNDVSYDIMLERCDPSTILKLVAVVEKAKEQLRLRDDRAHIAATESSAATRAAELMDNGERMVQGWAALRSALSALDDREPA